VSFNYNAINSGLATQAKQSEADIAEFQTTMDPDSTADLIQLQQMTSQWSVRTELTSSITKALADALRGISQKIG